VGHWLLLHHQLACQTVELGVLHQEVQEELAQLVVVVHIPVLNKIETGQRRKYNRQTLMAL